ncbi:MAG TPA: asparaginase [Acidimicrobiales bacterium]|nr:asparaginase [Acidimicrobiales bacterium]
MIGAPRQVAVLGLGGTIAMAAGSAGGAEPALSAADVIRTVPALGGLPIELVVDDVHRLPGASLGFDDLESVATIARQRCASGADGVVVTQGTDTIEESAYLLDLLHTGPEPIVVTGAMRNASLAGADGPANVLAAVQVAASTEARDQGCLVVLADEIHAASRVRKTHATSLTAFASPNGGPLGYVVEGRPRFVNHLPARFCVPPDLRRTDRRNLPRVGLAVVSLGDDGALLDGAADRLDGLVVAGFGVGHVPQWLVDDLAEIAARIPVVLASRTGAGTVLAATYRFVGSESTLSAAGLIPAWFLDPYKARILLHVLLGSGCDHPTIAAAFAAAGGYAPVQSWPWPIAEADGRRAPRRRRPPPLPGDR